MGKQGYQPEQIISKLREVEVLLSTGQSVQTAIRQTGVTRRHIPEKEKQNVNPFPMWMYNEGSQMAASFLFAQLKS